MFFGKPMRARWPAGVVPTVCNRLYFAFCASVLDV